LKTSDISAVKGWTAKRTTLGLFTWAFQGLEIQEVCREDQAKAAAQRTAKAIVTVDLCLPDTSGLVVNLPISSLPQAMELGL